MTAVPKITPALIAGLPKNGPTDPIEFYRRPLVGRVRWLRTTSSLRVRAEVEDTSR